MRFMKKITLTLATLLVTTNLSIAGQQQMPTVDDLGNLQKHIKRKFIPLMQLSRKAGTTFNLDELESILKHTPGMIPVERRDGHKHFEHPWSNQRFELKNRGGEKNPRCSEWQGTFESLQDFMNFWGNEVFAFQNGKRWKHNETELKASLERLIRQN
jgi:hypothetical protein